VLLCGLGLTAPDLPVLAAALPEADARLSLWQEVSVADRRQRSVRALAGLDPASTLRLLEQAPIGTLDGLLHCLRHDVLDWTQPPAAGGGTTAERAGAVVADALVASYLRAELAPATRRALALGWVGAVRRLPIRPVDLGPQHRAVAECLERIGAASAAQLAGLGAAADRRGWAMAMHSASWAVYLAGRVRAAAAAQLRLVMAIRGADATVAQLAAGGWNAASGAVQALLVRDMLDAENVRRLLEPYRAVFAG
jgi:hypothetical protein